MTSPFDPHAQTECARTRRAARAAALAVAGAALFGAAEANAQTTVDCETLTQPNKIVGIGGSAGTPFIKRLATQLAKANPPITVIYADPGACQAMTSLVPGATGQVVSLAGKTAHVWDATGKDTSCTFSSGSTAVAEWGSMAQEATTCQGIDALPATVGDYLSTISGFSLIVPNASDQFSISAEAIYYIYGLGAGTGHDVDPWVNPAAIGSRTTTSAAGLLLAKASGIPLSRPLAYLPTNDVKTNSGAIDFVTTNASAVATPRSALAFCSTETADTKRDVVRTLAFKAQDQDYAYFPDSSTTATDKKNLRDGRYFLWNKHHFFALKARLTANPSLQKFINIVTSTEELPGDQTFLDLQIANGNVPTCAMNVTRTQDMGPLSSFQPDKPCGCYFDSKTTGTTPSCQTCQNDTGCSAGSVCSYGFCEVK